MAVLFEETVTTGGSTSGGRCSYGSLITEPTLKITLNGVPYIINGQYLEDTGISGYVYGEFSDSGPIFINYPFVFESTRTNSSVNTVLYTETAGTYTLKVETPKAVNKVVYGSTVLVDMTDATATAADIMEGYTAYGADGQKIIGTATGSSVIVTDTTDEHGGTIRTITTGGTVKLQTKTITPTSSQQVVNPDTGYNGFSQVTVNAGGSSSDFIITITYNTTTQKWEPDCTWAELSAANTAGKTIIVNATDPNDSYEPTADTTGFFDNDNYFEYKVNWFDFNQSLGLDGWVIHDIYEFSSSELTLSQRDSFDSPKTLISKSITANGTYNAITTDSVDGYSSVTVNVPTGSTINNQNKTVTPTESQQSITADSGYTGLGTVTVGAISSAYVGSGIDRRDSDDLTASGATISVPAGYYSAAASKSVASGSATGPSSLSGSSASITTGTNTITLTKTGITTTPTVSAGYVSSATASTATVSLTASVTTKAAATITPGTTNQTIASGTYLTGTQTIAGDADLVASNIVSGVQIFGVTGNVVLQNYYTGSSAPSSSLGSNGDLYLQS